MGYQDEWLLLEAEDDIDEIEHRKPTEEFLFYQEVSNGNIKAVQENCQQERFLDSFPSAAICIHLPIQGLLFLPTSYIFLNLPLRHIIIIPILLRRNARKFPELLNEMALGRKRQAVCNINNRIIAVSKKIFGFFYLL